MTLTRRAAVWLWLAIAAADAPAAPWEFAPPIEVSPARAGVFHHLESSGRKNLAVSGQVVGLVWEDNHSGGTQVYVAFRNLDQDRFTAPARVSTGKAAYEPVIAALGAGAFVIAWEQDEAVWARVAAAGALGPAVVLAPRRAGQVSLAASAPDTVVAVWVQRSGHQGRVRMAPLAVDRAAGKLRLAAEPVEPDPVAAEQLYPTVAVVGRRVTVAWEDRRHGHTVLYYAHAPDGRHFGPAKILNEIPPRSEGYGKGTGVMRVSLAAHGPQGVAAAWLDKRELAVGYDVYAAFSEDAGARFGANEKVQDEFGNHISQWHASLTADVAGTAVVAWDDDRDGSGDIWLSWRTASGWSEDMAVPGASGPGIQSDPVLALDAVGNLHLAWIERDAPLAPTRLRYTVGQRVQE